MICEILYAKYFRDPSLITTQPSNIQIHLDPKSEAKRLIKKHIKASEDKINELIDIKIAIKNLIYVTIHTDGSLQNNKMDIGWIINTENKDYTFQARTS